MPHLPLRHAPRLARLFLRMSRGRLAFASFNVTNRCNERCPMCQVIREDAAELTLDEMRPIFRQLRRAGVGLVEISGGEPFLRRDIFGILSLLDEEGLLASATTNGTTVTGETVEGLRSARSLVQLGVSLDSLDRATYAALRGRDLLDEAVAGIERLAAARLPFPLKVNFTMSRLNVGEVFELLEWASARGLSLSMFPVNQGKTMAHRREDPLFAPSPSERERMAAAFRELARRKRAGAPLWELSDFYELSAEYVLGRPVGRCDAGRLYVDLRSDGLLASCVEHEGVVDLRTTPVSEALARLAGRQAIVDRCSEETPCCYTCTYNLSLTARRVPRYVRETLGMLSW